MNASGGIGVVVIEHPPEPVVKTSMLLVLVGFGLLTSVVLLAIIAWAAQGERDGQADVFGKRVTVRDVAERYKAVWTPGKFWPRDAFTHTKKRKEGSPLFKVVWTFLVAWLTCCAFYLIFAGLVQSIEVFREEAHVRAAALVSAALCMASIWPVLFRIGSSTNGVATGIAIYSSGDEDAAVEDARSVPAGVSTHSKTKEFFLWASFVLLAIAALVAVAGSATLRAWTLPGPQYGTLLFLGPGYGLFAGWLLFAATLNLSVAISYNSYPAGTLPWPETRTKYTHRGSLWPPVLALVISGIAVLSYDPAMPLPMLIGIFLFTPRQKTHLAASLVLVLGILVASWLVVSERTE
mgnify:CR=1 FL=1